MEWRIFLPLFVEDVDIPNEIKEYNSLIESLKKEFGINVHETRDDMYLIGGDHFGVKFRELKKFEIKIRDGVIDSVPGVEHWRKYALGKKSFTHYTAEVEQKLKDLNVFRHDIDKYCLEHPQFISVRKTREIKFCNATSIEMCTLFPSLSHSISQCSSWLSVAVEGNLDDINQFLLRNDMLQHLWQAINLAQSIYKNKSNLRIPSEDTLPILSGYPSWIRYVSRNYSENDKMMMLSKTDSILRIMKSHSASSSTINEFSPSV